MGLAGEHGVGVEGAFEVQRHEHQDLVTGPLLQGIPLRIRRDLHLRKGGALETGRPVSHDWRLEGHAPGHSGDRRRWCGGQRLPGDRRRLSGCLGRSPGALLRKAKRKEKEKKRQSDQRSAVALGM